MGKTTTISVTREVDFDVDFTDMRCACGEALQYTADEDEDGITFRVEPHYCSDATPTHDQLVDQIRDQSVTERKNLFNQTLPDYVKLHLAEEYAPLCARTVIDEAIEKLQAMIEVLRHRQEGE